MTTFLSRANSKTASTFLKYALFGVRGSSLAQGFSGNRQNIVKVTGLGTGPDGTLYVPAATRGAVWEGPQILAFGRDWVYPRMVMPFPAGLTREQVRGITSLELDGRPAPLLRGVSMGLYPDFSTPCPCNLTVSPDRGRLYLPCYDRHGSIPPSIGMLDTQGGCPADKLVVAIGAAGKRPMLAGFSCLAVSSDGQHVYAGG